MDLTEIAAGIGIVKTGFDAIRTALGLVKDVQGALPAGEKKEAAARALEEAEKQIRLGEAQIAKALGYPLCRCTFPPTPMLAVGYRPYNAVNSPDPVKKAEPKKAENCGHCGKPLPTLRSAASRCYDRYCAKTARKARATELPRYYRDA